MIATGAYTLGTTANGVVYVDATTAASNTTISNMTLDGDNSSGLGGNVKFAAGVLVVSEYQTTGVASNNTHIKNMEIRHMGAAGIYISGISSKVTNNNIHDIEGNGIYITGTKYNRANGNIIGGSLWTGNTVSKVSLGLQIGAGKSYDGIDIDPNADYNTVSYNVVSGDDIIVLDSYFSGQYSTGNIVDHNIIYNSLEAGIDISGEENSFQVTNNAVYQSAFVGITVNGPATGTNVIRGNVLYSTGKLQVTEAQGGDQPEGIQMKNTGQTLKAGPQDVAITNNIVWTVDTSMTTTPKYPAVFLWNPGSGNTVENNVFPNRCGDGDNDVVHIGSAIVTVSGNKDSGVGCQ